MPIPLRYVGGSEPVTTQLDFFQFGTGIGFKELFAGTSESSSGALSFILDTQALQTGEPEDVVGDQTGSTQDQHRGYTIMDTAGGGANISVSFALTELTEPLIVEGKAKVSFTHVLFQTGGNPTYATVGIAKNSTNIATMNTQTRVSSGAYTEAVLIDVPRTKFSVGDQLTISIRETYDNATLNVYVLHDPLNRAITNVLDDPDTNPTKCILFLPVVID